MVIPAPFSAEPGVDADTSKLDGMLLDLLAASGSDEEIEIIAQFKGSVRSADRQMLDDLGFERVYEYHVVPGIYARGTKDAILSLSGYERTFWIEYNYPMELLLDETTSVVNATNAWNRRIVDSDGRIDASLNLQSYLYGIDGRGVTIAVVDTGVDAGHPDLDYKEKTVENWHKNSPSDPWIEMENSDTSYGHGTHCAGIAAGNGDASAGRRRGTAPGSTLIGVGGDWTPVYWAVLAGMEWCYDNSKPGNNPHNIRVVSNSWGSEGAEYDPQDAVSLMTQALTYENNVVVCFAAGNSGEDNHDGHTITTNPQSNTPASIGVAATEHDGEGMAVFTSRGEKGNFDTYPDIAAPGVNIWATKPRGTWLDLYQSIDEDLYYMAISGTSMATPHVSGITALMWQACPELKVSNYHGEYNGTDEEWYEKDTTLIHEIEYIYKMTADYIEPSGDNGVPDESDSGIHGRRFDYAQGYGMVNVDRAVAVAMTLHVLRTADNNGDGSPDNPDASVDRALEIYNDLLKEGEVDGATDIIQTSWRGEWAHLINQSGNPGGAAQTYETEQAHSVYIPNGTEQVTLTFQYVVANFEPPTLASVELTCDTNGDGSNDLPSQTGDTDGTKVYVVDPSGSDTGRMWHFNVDGNAMGFIDSPDEEYPEPTVQYTVHVQVKLPASGEHLVDFYKPRSSVSPYTFGDPSPDYQDGTVYLATTFYDMSGVDTSNVKKDKGSSDPDYQFLILVGIMVLGVMVGHLLTVGTRKKDV